MKNLELLIQEITHCPLVKEIYDGGTNNCHEIVNQQKDASVSFEKFKGPESWNGRLDTVKILVISSNPSIGVGEYIPDRSWNMDDVIDFYQNRFDELKKWVKDLKVLQHDGTYVGPVKNWSATVNRMKYIFDDSVKIGSDYALLELVHCKSLGEKGVHTCFQTCTDKYFEKVMKHSKANVLIITGAFAKDFFFKRYNIREKESNLGFGLYNEITINNINRLLIFLPHTNARMKRKAEYYINLEEKAQINKFLNNH